MTLIREQRTSRRHHMHTTALQTPRILCVDDDPDLQVSFELRMRSYDVQVDRAYYGMQGITEAIKTCPDLILADLAMPNGNGEYLIECIKCNSATAHIPTIILTGMRNPKLKGRILHAGASAYLHKPIAFDELLSHISKFIPLRARDDSGELK